VQTYLFDKAAVAPETGIANNGMTRVAGASIAALSAYALHSGLNGNHEQKKVAYAITAGHSAVGASTLPPHNPILSNGPTYM
jgi:hypothetical protein